MASSVRDWQSRRRNEKTFAERKDRVTAAKWESRTIEGGRSEKTPRCDLAVSCVDGTCPAGSVLFKISFVNDWDSASVMSQELLLRLLSDRNFYFSEYRDLGNLRAGPDGVHPAPRLKGVFFDSAGEILRLASMSPKDLLKEALEKIKPCADEGTEDARQQERSIGSSGMRCAAAIYGSGAANHCCCRCDPPLGQREVSQQRRKRAYASRVRAISGCCGRADACPISGDRGKPQTGAADDQR